MWPYSQFPEDLVTFTEENLNGKLHFLCSAYYIKEGKYLFWICMISAKSRARQLFLVILLTSNDKTREESYINKTLEDGLIISGKRLQLVKIEWTFMWNIHYLLINSVRYFLFEVWFNTEEILYEILRMMTKEQRETHFHLSQMIMFKNPVCLMQS